MRRPRLRAFSALLGPTLSATSAGRPAHGDAKSVPSLIRPRGGVGIGWARTPPLLSRSLPENDRSIMQRAYSAAASMADLAARSSNRVKVVAWLARLIW
jgi:hypothetical protein